MGIFNFPMLNNNEQIRRDEILQVLKFLQSSNFITKKLETIPAYRSDKYKIKNGVSRFFGKAENDPYPRNSINELIKILEEVKNGDVKKINELIDKNKLINSKSESLFLNIYNKKYVDIRILGIDGYHHSYENNEKLFYKYRESYESIENECNKIIKELNKNFENKLKTIIIDIASSDYYIQFSIENKK